MVPVTSWNEDALEGPGSLLLGQLLLEKVFGNGWNWPLESKQLFVPRASQVPSVLRMTSFIQHTLQWAWPGVGRGCGQLRPETGMGIAHGMVGT